MREKDYGSIKFTDAERAALIEARKKICNYINTEIIPYMVEQKSIQVDFGGSYMSSRVWGDETTNHHLYIYAEPKHFHRDSSCGYEDRYISIGYSQKYGHVNNLEKANSPYDICPIVDNWGEVKSEIRKQLQEMKADNIRIFNFEV